MWEALTVRVGVLDMVREGEGVNELDREGEGWLDFELSSAPGETVTPFEALSMAAP